MRRFSEARMSAGNENARRSTPDIVCVWITFLSQNPLSHEKPRVIENFLSRVTPMAAAIDGRGERALQLLLLLALVLGAAGACDCDFANGPPAVVRCVQPQTHLCGKSLRLPRARSTADSRERTPAMCRCPSLACWNSRCNGPRPAMLTALRAVAPTQGIRSTSLCDGWQRAMVCLVSRAKV